jgi:hypothetical protein
MSGVAVAGAPGATGVTTTAMLLAAGLDDAVLVEADPSGGDVAAWMGGADQPGWSSAVAADDRSWLGLERHLQRLPSGLRVLVAPTRSAEAAVAVRAGLERFGPLLTAMSDVVAVLDCGRITGPTAATSTALLTVLVVRQQADSAPATVARIDRAAELIGRTRTSAEGRVGLVVVGAVPYRPAEIAAHCQVELFAELADDRRGAAMVAGGWTIGRGAGRSALARSARPLVERVTVMTRDGALEGTWPAPATGGSR